MNGLLDAGWRAAAYCLHPKVIVLSLLPLLIGGGLAWLLGYFFWESAVESVRAAMEAMDLVSVLLRWLDAIGGSSFRSMLPPLIVVALAVPVIIVISLLLVAMMMTPALVNLVAARRFPRLERRQGASLLGSLLQSSGCTLAALFLLIVSLPFWLIPPLVLILPPLIWGWLTYRVLAFDVLSEHADADERRQILREHRWTLLSMGLVAGYLGAAPSLLWAVSAMTLVFAPLLILFAIWIYTLVFAFSALWFAHYALAALEALRARRLAPGNVDAAPALAGPATEAPLFPPL